MMQYLVEDPFLDHKLIYFYSKINFFLAIFITNPSYQNQNNFNFLHPFLYTYVINNSYLKF